MPLLLHQVGAVDEHFAMRYQRAVPLDWPSVCWNPNRRRSDAGSTSPTPHVTEALFDLRAGGTVEVQLSAVERMRFRQRAFASLRELAHHLPE